MFNNYNDDKILDMRVKYVDEKRHVPKTKCVSCGRRLSHGVDAIGRPVTRVECRYCSSYVVELTQKIEEVFQMVDGNRSKFDCLIRQLS